MTFTIEATDEDQDQLTYSAIALPTGAAFDPATRQCTWTPAAAQTGNFTASFKVRDEHGLEDTVYVNITVRGSSGGNQPPVLQPIGAKSVRYGQPLAFTVTATDPDNDQLALWITGTPSGADYKEARFTWTPTSSQVGTYYVTFGVQDEHGARASEVVAITVTGNSRHAPILNPIGDKTIAAGTTLRFFISGSDPDGDRLMAIIRNTPPGASFNTSTGEFVWTPRFNQIGSGKVTFILRDPGGLEASETITITVTAHDNRPPVLDPIPAQTVRTGENLYVKALYSDPDGDPIKLRISNKPPGARFNRATGELFWTPKATQAGSGTVTIIAIDGHGESTQQSFLITVSAIPNAPPQIEPIGDQTVQAGTKLSFTVRAADPDGDRMTIKISGKPSGALFDARFGTFTWTPRAGQAGSGEVSFTVRDEHKAKTTQTIRITVTP